MSSFFDLVRLVTGSGDANPDTQSPGRAFTKWVFVDDDSDKKEVGEEPTISERIPESSTNDLNKPTSSGGDLPKKFSSEANPLTEVTYFQSTQS